MKKVIQLLIIVGVVFFGWFWWNTRPADTGNIEKAFVKIDQGQSFTSIAHGLEEQGIIRSTFAFKVLAKIKGLGNKIQAGTFAISRDQSASQILTILTGVPEDVSVTIPEGYTVADIDALMASKGLGKPGDILNCAFTCDFSTFEFLPKANVGSQAKGYGSRLEGYLFPDTYFISEQGYIPKFFLERLLGEFRRRVVTPHEADIKKSKYSLNEIVTMASLLEEESRKGEERKVIAGILWKRLEGGVLLGVDATVRYFLHKPIDTITASDLQTESDYNTRKVQGLPPTPIANPGESSIEAALDPTASEFWYYLHDTTGQVRYARTNDEHNENRAKYLR